MNRQVSDSLATRKSDSGRYFERLLITVAVVAVAALLCYAAQVLLLAFAGILLAIFLDALTAWTRDHTGWRRIWAFTAVMLTITGLVALLVWRLEPRVASQINQLAKELPESLNRLQAYLRSSGLGSLVFSQMKKAVSGATGNPSTVLWTTFDVAAGILVVLVVGIYVGAAPDSYEHGLLRLFPRDKRARVRQVLAEIAYTLRWWILGQTIPMAVLGVATMIGLWALHVPLAFTLGLFTALLIFIPYIGSIIAAVVAGLVALSQGPTQVVYVMLLFIGIHTAEGYLLTPLVQKRAVLLPPALTILAQILMEVVVGFLGLALATPLTAATLVAVKMLYLHEEPEHH